jgi:3-oxoacyl-[acyl-carrier protein] reductase
VRLRDKVAIVTGGGRSIGRTISRRLASEGARVVVADIVEENASRVAGEIMADGGAALSVHTDVADPPQVEAMVKAVVDKFTRIDLLVNNAGIGLTRLFLDTSLEEWQRLIQVNLTGTFLCSQAVARVMVKQGSGKIINIASLSGQRAGTGRAAYGVSKAGVSLLTKQMALELAPHGITVNEVVPGPVDTEMTRVTHDAATRQAYYDRIPMRRYATQAEIASAIAFLASAEADCINGHSLNVDGGYAAAGIMFNLAPAERTEE